jgi:hypothetical protein
MKKVIGGGSVELWTRQQCLYFLDFIKSGQKLDYRVEVELAALYKYRINQDISE